MHLESHCTVYYGKTKRLVSPKKLREINLYVVKVEINLYVIKVDFTEFLLKISET